MGQHWMYKGEHALIVFDDLSKQAEAYREISLLLRRPAGREAYPGDVFYLHSRLLERCAKLSDDMGGSLTGLPIIETKGNDISAYIPTNVISITDGQIYLEADLQPGRAAGHQRRHSVSRVGKALIRPCARSRAPCASTWPSSGLWRRSPCSPPTWTRRRGTSWSAGPAWSSCSSRASTVPIEKQVIAIWAGGNGYLDDIPVEDVRRFEAELLEFMDASHPDVGEHIRNEGTLPDEVEAKLKEAVEAFKGASAPGRPPGPQGEGRRPDGRGHRGPGLGQALPAQPRGVRGRGRPGRPLPDPESLSHGRPAPGRPPAHPHGAVDSEDHQGLRAHLGLAGGPCSAAVEASGPTPTRSPRP